MVLFFSATGNTRFIAKQLAKRLDDECIDLLERIKTKDHSGFYSKKPYVICAPIYVCEPPIFLMKYLKKVKLSGNPNVYFVFTSGGYSGIAGRMAHQLMFFKKMNFMGHADVVMPRNYVASDMYDMLPCEENRERIREGAKQCAKIAFLIRKHRRLHARHAFLFESIVIRPFTPVWTRVMQPVKPFHTTDACIGCGKCAAVCPLNNIEMVEVDGKKRPKWLKPCAHCMACIGNCPFEAVEFGDITKNKEKYSIAKYVKRKYL